MRREDFYDVVDDRLEKIRSILLNKEKEYASGGDRLSSFNIGAKRTGKIREEIIQGFMLKHELAVESIVNEIKVGNLPTLELINEKFGDVINYYIILEASIRDRIDKEVNGRIRESKEVSAV